MCCSGLPAFVCILPDIVLTGPDIRKQQWPHEDHWKLSNPLIGCDDDTLPIHHYEHHLSEFQTRIYENIYSPEGKHNHKMLVRNEDTGNIH